MRGLNPNSLKNLLKSGKRMGRAPKIIIDGNIQCCRCRQWKSLDSFHSNPSSPTLVSTTCRLCKSETLGKRATNSLRIGLGQVVKAHRSLHASRSKRRKELAIDSCVSLELVLGMWNDQHGRCAVTGRPMTHIYGQGRNIMTNASIDRIDNSRGYERDNIRLVCKAVNYMKHSMSDGELADWCQAILDGIAVKAGSEAGSLNPAQGRN